jgi:hypothetical protein
MKNKIMKKSILLSFVFTAILLFCKKEKSASNNCSTNVSSIAGCYKTVSVKYKANSSSSEQDLFAILNTCEKDDIIKLNTNVTAEYINAGTACSPNGSDTSNWTLNGNTITMDGTAGSILLFNCYL